MNNANTTSVPRQVTSDHGPATTHSPGYRLPPTAYLDQLEPRRLLSTISGGALIIDGTAGNDVILVDTTTTHYRVNLNGRIQSFQKPLVFSFRIRGLGGSDRITIASTITRPANIDAGAGNDIVTTALGKDTILGGSGNDSLTAGPGNDQLVGGLGDDVLRGNDGNDGLEGSEGADLLFGEAGLDVLVGDVANATTAAGPDTLSGGLGADWAIYTGRAAALNLSLDGAANDGAPLEKDSIGIDIENLAGGHGADTLTGNAASNRLVGNGGNDSLTGGAGNDYLEGLAGNDTLAGGDGHDTLLSGGGRDSLLGNAGDDLFYASDGFETFIDGGLGFDWSFHDSFDRVRLVERFA